MKKILSTNSTHEGPYKIKGFTLIELLATIIILALIGLIVYPTLNNVIQNNKEKLYNKQIEELVRYTNIWTINNSDKMSEENTYLLTFEELHKTGLLSDSTVKNPKTNEDLAGCMRITKMADNNYDIKYSEDCSIEKLTLTYMNGSSKYVSQEHNIGSKIATLDCNATREGYIFRGWDTESTANNVVYNIDDTITIDSNITLYAVWKPKLSIERLTSNPSGMNVQNINVNSFTGSGTFNFLYQITLEERPGTKYVVTAENNTLVAGNFNGVIDESGKAIIYTVKTQYFPNATATYTISNTAVCTFNGDSPLSASVDFEVMGTRSSSGGGGGR